MKIFLLLQSLYFCRLTSRFSNDSYKVCSPILRYYYTILNIHYKVLLMKIFLLLQSLYFCRLTSRFSNDSYKVCSPILRYYYSILNIHYKVLLMKIFLLLQSSYFCRLTSKSSNDPYKVCSPILRYDHTILNTYYKLLLIVWSYLKSRLQSLYGSLEDFEVNLQKYEDCNNKNIFISKVCNGYSKLYSHISRLDYKLCREH